uniref:Uncharacterized protein n=1 Tax=Rhizophora mucronata TaxID=61149 RepID=A0A2P2PIN1_RHIMU
MDFSEQVDNFVYGASSSTEDGNICDQVGLLSSNSNSSRTLVASDDVLLDDLDFLTVASVKDDQAGMALEWFQE